MSERRSITIVVPDLHIRGHARQATLLADHWVGQGHAVTVFSIAGPGPLQPAVPVLGRPGRRLIDLEDLLVLRKHVSQSDRVVAFGARSVGFLATALLGKSWPKMVAILSPTEPIGFLARRGIARLHRLFWTRQHPHRPHDEVLQPAVELHTPADWSTVQPAVFLTGGDHATRDRFLPAVWGFEILEHTEPEVRQIVVGDGPGRAPLEEAARNLAGADYRQEFVGLQPDLEPFWARTRIALAVPDRGGVNFALEALSRGIPLIAAKTDDMTSLLGEPNVALFVDRNDPPGIAKAMARLLHDRALADKLSQAGREMVAGRHSVGRLSDRLDRSFGA
jgi:Glycosyl transferases group 1